MLKLLVCCTAWDQQPVPVPHTHPADDAAAGDGGVHHRDGPEELPLEDAVEVLGAADSHEAVGVGELGEAAQLVVVLEAGADGHRCGREHGAAPRGTAASDPGGGRKAAGGAAPAAPGGTAPPPAGRSGRSPRHEGGPAPAPAPSRFFGPVWQRRWAPQPARSSDLALREQHSAAGLAAAPRAPPWRGVPRHASTG